MGNEDRLLTAADVAEFLGMHVQTVYEKTAAGDIPHLRIGRNIRYRKAAIDKWLAGQTVAAQVEPAV